MVEASVPAEASPVGRTVGQAIAEQLAAAGARFAFTVPGESFLGLIDGLVGAGVRVIATRHEGGAAYMAEAASQLTGRPQLAMGTRAVGASNLAIGIHAAWADSAPMVALIGQVRRDRRGLDSFQEADLVNSIGRLAKWAVEIDDPARADALTGEAIARAMGGRPGPVLISLPEDVLDEVVTTSPPAGGSARTPVPDEDAVKAVVKLLASSRRGAIVAGAGVVRANASRRLMRLAEALGVPVFSSWRRPDAVPNGHPLYLGMAGLAAAHTVWPRLREADVVLVVGSRLSEMTSFDYRFPTEGQRWAHVDLDPRPLEGRDPAPEIAVTADAGRFVDAALSLVRSVALDAENRQQRLDAAAETREAYVAAQAAVAESSWDGPGVHPGRVVATLGRLLPAEATITSDAGNFAGWLARGYRFRRPGTFLGPTSGAMGFGLPAAIGAALVHPRRPAVAIAGDGGFAMTMQEVETAVRELVPVVALVFDNRRYGTIRMHQEREGREIAATDLGPIDFAAFARASGAVGFSVRHDDEVEDALKQALESGQPAVVHLALDPSWVSVDQPPSGAFAADGPEPVASASSSSTDIASAP